MADAENKAIVRQFLEIALSTSNLVLADELLGPNYVNHGLVAGSSTKDRETWKRDAAMVFASVPDLQILIRDLLAEGDAVVARYTLQGTHQGDYFGIRASGHPLSIEGIGWYRLKSGKIVEEWLGLDISGVMQQFRFRTKKDRRKVYD